MLLGPILLLLTLAGCFLFLLKPVWFPPPITATALTYDGQFTRSLWIVGIIFVAVQVLLACVILRGGKLSTSANKSGHRGLELAWTAATAGLFITMAIAGSRSWAKIPVEGKGIERIEVYAHQFAWDFRYPGPDGRFGRTSREFINDAAGNPVGIDPADADCRDDLVSASLRIPAGRDVLLLLHSRDVIHDFFVRELRTKQDIVPGMEIPFQLRVDRPGTYEIACAELCGLGHSQMRSVLIVLPPDEYDRWKLKH